MMKRVMLSQLDRGQRFQFTPGGATHRRVELQDGYLPCGKYAYYTLDESRNKIAGLFMDSLVFVEVPARRIRDIPTGEKFTYGGNEYVKMDAYGHDIDGLCGNIAAMCVSDNTLSTFSRESVEE